MPISVIVGGQYGSEGKGKVSHFFAKKYNATAVIRVGGPNSGHTVIDKNGEALIFKHLPTSSIIKGVKSVLTAGNYINVDILLKEIKTAKLYETDLLIDPYAVIITENDIANEQEGLLKDSIGSTACGLGSTILNRVARNTNVVFAKDVKELHSYITDTNSYLRQTLDDDERIIIEGTQGFGLSLLHSNLHPYSTSRDTTAASFVSEAGLSPLDVDDVIMVLRAFPIRVGGNSGPLKNETSWEEITENAGSTIPIKEFTSVTKKLRRVAYFDKDIVLRAIRHNNPTKIVLNHVDYFKANVTNETISLKMVTEIERIEKLINKKIDFLGINRIDVIERSQLQKISLLSESLIDIK